MTDVDEFIDKFLQHRTEYDPEARREYYLRTRKLKGRKKSNSLAAEQRIARAKALAMQIKNPTARANVLARIASAEGKLKKKGSTVDPRSKRTGEGDPLPKRGTRMEEDQTPDKSPRGSRLVDYDPRGLGIATYADGHVYDARVGWLKKKVARAQPRGRRYGGSRGD